MGQIWNILNIDAKQKSPEGVMKLGEFFFDNLSTLYESLMVCLPIMPKEVDEWLKRGNKVRQPGPFGKLPVELIDQVYRELSDDPERMHVTVSLAVTCKHLLEVGKRHILRSMPTSRAPWVGGRLVCLGEYTEDKDLPQGLLSEFELKEAQEAKVPRIPQEDMDFGIFASETYKETEIWHSRWYLLGSACCAYYEPIQERRAPLTPLKRLEVEMMKLLCCAHHATYPTDGPMVLCNMTKAEYVRDDKMSKMVFGRRERDKVQFGLAHALLSRICWSPSYDSSMAGDGAHLKQLTKGPWVGDTFCITTLDKMPPPGAGKKWKYATAEVDELLMYVWEVNHEYYD